MGSSIPAWEPALAAEVLREAACEAYEQQNWHASAALFYDAAKGRGVRSRIALKRALRGPTSIGWLLLPRAVKRWMAVVDERMAKWRREAGV